MFRSLFSLLVSGVLAGVSIGLGGSVFLRVKDAAIGMPSVVLGSLLFAVGLFTVCTRGYALYTGKLCYLFDQPNKLAYLGQLVVIWVGNLLGCMALGGLENLTGICGAKGINAVALGMADAKLADSALSLFILGLLCNVFIYIAVNGYAKNPHTIGKYMAILFGVVCFITLGTEHSVADMYYFCVSERIYTEPTATLTAIAIISLGNFVGGLALPRAEVLIARLTRA